MWQLEEEQVECPHRNYDPVTKYCPDCETWLSLDPSEERRIQRALKSEHAQEITPDTSPLDWKKWRLVVDSRAPDSDLIGAREIARTIKAVSDVDLAPAKLKRTGKLPARRNLIIIGGVDKKGPIGDLQAQAHLELSADNPGFDGFVLQYHRGLLSGGRDCILVTGSNQRGAMYGCFELAERIRRGDDLRSLDLRERPYFRIRGGNVEGEHNLLLHESTCATYRPTEEELLGFAKMRANLLILRFNLWPHPDELVTYKHLPEVKKVPDWVHQNIRDLKQDIKLAKKYGFLVLVQLGMWHKSWADEQIMTAHPDAQAVRDKKLSLTPHEWWYTLCPSHPIMRRYVEAEVRELFELYPDLDGIYTWSGSDCSPLACECKKCLKYPWSQRQVDYHTLLYQTLKTAKPEAIYIMDLSNLEAYHHLFIQSLPKGIYYSSWSRYPSGLSYPELKTKDPLNRRLRNYLPQLSTWSEGLVCSTTPVFDLEALQWDIGQYAQSEPPGLMDHHPFLIADFGKPDRYFDIAEPFHYAWLKWAWNPNRIEPEEMIERWAQERFPNSWKRVVRAYAHLKRVRDKAFIAQRVPQRGYFSSLELLDWSVLRPEAKIEGPRLVREQGPRDDRQAPYGFAKPGRTFYLYEKKLRALGLNRNTLRQWRERFDPTGPVSSAVREIKRAVAAEPENRHLQTFLLKLQAVSAHTEIYRDHMWAGLRYQVAMDLKASGRKEESLVELNLVKRDLLRAATACLSYLVGPTSLSLNWSRWAEKGKWQSWDSIKERLAQICQLLKEEPDYQGLFMSALKQVRRRELRLGWEPEKTRHPSPKCYHLFDLSAQCNKGPDDQLNDERKWYQENFDDHYRRFHRDYRQLPAGLQYFFGIPFQMVDPQSNQSKNYVMLRGKPEPQLPTATEELPVGRTLESLHFLANIYWFELPGTALAQVRVKYADGEMVEIPIRAWQEVTCYRGPEQTPEAKVAWLEMERPKEKIASTAGMLGINYFSWDNPRPDQEIASIQVVSENTRAVPLLFAVTGRVR